MRLKIWHRAILKEFLQTLLLFLISFYGLYVFIDFATHNTGLGKIDSFAEAYKFITYYFYLFCTKLEILLPIGLMLAFIKTVCRYNSDGELTSLLCAGISIHQIIKPLLLVGLIATAAVYISEEFIAPQANSFIKQLEISQKKIKSEANLSAKVTELKDQSILIYGYFDESENLFEDLFWVKSIDHIYKIKSLKLENNLAVGKFVDELVRENGEIVLKNSYNLKTFPNLSLPKKKLYSNALSVDSLPLSYLLKKALSLHQNALNLKESRMLTNLYWKALMPWLCLLALLIPTSLAIEFSRHFNPLLVYVKSLFYLILFYFYLDSVQVISNRQVATPFWLIFIPWLIVNLFFSYKYFKARVDTC